MHNKYWVGVRESEVCYLKNYFTDTLTIFGKRKEKGLIQPFNIHISKNIDHNDVKNDDAITAYNLKQMNNILDNDSNAEFMFYNQVFALKYYKDVKNKICLNDYKLVEQLSDKLYAREYYKTKVPCIKHFILEGKDISLDSLNKLFDNKSKYVVQSQTGSGGSGTLIFDNDTKLNKIKKDNKYLVTEYYENAISMNTHLMITKDDVIVLPSSIQIIEDQYDHLVYKGFDYIAFNNLNDSIKNKVFKYAKIIGEDIRKRGYLGVCGIDFLISNDEVYFIEINARFQNSSVALNKALLENSQLSLQEMNYNCFYNKEFDYKKINVNYSGYIIYYNEESVNVPSIEPIEILDKPDCILDIDKLSYKQTNIYRTSII